MATSASTSVFLKCRRQLRSVEELPRKLQRQLVQEAAEGADTASLVFFDTFEFEFDPASAWAADPASWLATVAKPMFGDDLVTETGHPFEHEVLIGSLPHFESPWTTHVKTILARAGFGDGVRSVTTHVALAHRDLPFVFRVATAVCDRMTQRVLVHTIERQPPVCTDTVKEYDEQQSLSEHCRHWLFNGVMVIDGETKPHSMMDLVRSTHKNIPDEHQSCLVLCDNASATDSWPRDEVAVLLPETPGKPGPMVFHPCPLAITYTSETHNMPTAVAPCPGAETGAGGNLRDSAAAGRGSIPGALTLGYSVGNLRLDGADAPWEDAAPPVQHAFASALDIIIQASNGACDYSNKFGRPGCLGYARSFELLTAPPQGEGAAGAEADATAAAPSISRVGYVKPIMFCGTTGTMSRNHLQKRDAAEGMQVVKIGGPAYRVGMGGGAASSTGVQSTVDHMAVQRGDAEMGQKADRVVRACVEMRDQNPLLSVHDQGAGGNGNVLKELVAPRGANVNLDLLCIGDPTMNAVELFSAEYQENFAALVADGQPLEHLKAICARENVPVSVLGAVDSGEIFRVTFKGDVVLETDHKRSSERRTFVDKRIRAAEPSLSPSLSSPSTGAVAASSTPDVKGALARVLPMLSVACKSTFVTIVDRSVTGLVAQQPTVGPLQLPLSDFSVQSLTYAENSPGVCSALGEQPLKGVLELGGSPTRMARMSVAEMLTNLSLCVVPCLEKVKCSANWMWPAKQDGQKAALYDAVEAVTELLAYVKVSIDGGKDSLSMAVTDTSGNVIPAPGTLVVTAYSPIVSVSPADNPRVTPDLKVPGGSSLVLVQPAFAAKQLRLGGSALLHAYFAEQRAGTAAVTALPAQLIAPDVDDPDALVALFECIQHLLREHPVLSGHDVSDGGLVTAVLEMAFAGNCGAQITVPEAESSAPLAFLFSEECGVVLEVASDKADAVVAAVKDKFGAHLVASVVATTTVEATCTVVAANGTVLLSETTPQLRGQWWDTSYRLDKVRMNSLNAEQEREALYNASAPFRSPPKSSPWPERAFSSTPRVAICREEGSNGDREMAAAFIQAGFEAWDVSMNDIEAGLVTLDAFRGLAFVGGFSFADTLGAGRAWAFRINSHASTKVQFDAFRNDQTKFALGVCNGCQLMAALGWLPNVAQLAHNNSGRFECRWTSVKVAEDTPAIMLRSLRGGSFGIWSAHAEGRFQPVAGATVTPAVTYIDAQGNATEAYPANPNGSPAGTAAVCSPDGRILGIMPHPERCVYFYQCPEDVARTGASPKAAPWSYMFADMHAWCEESA